jgi:hypothetical protein
MLAVPGLPACAVHVPIPVAPIVAEPPGRVAQVTVLAGPALTPVGPPTLTVALTVQLRASVTVTVSVPIARPVIVDEPLELVTVVPLDHVNVHGLYVPTAVAVALPPFAFAQVAAVEVILGGQHEPTAYKWVIGSLLHATLVHEPDCPSPDTPTDTSRSLPGVQALLVVIVTQNFHVQVFDASLSP